MQWMLQSPNATVFCGGIGRDNFGIRMQSLATVKRQAYNNEEMSKNLGIPNLRILQVTADFPNSFAIKSHNLNVWYPQDITQASGC